MEIKKFIIGDKFCSSNQIAEIQNPYSGEVVSKIYNASKEDFDKAITTAETAFQVTKNQSAWKRSDNLKKLANLVEKNQNTFTDLIVKEAGKPITFAKGEVSRAILTINLAAEEALRFKGDYLPVDISSVTEGYKAITSRFPIGVIAGISPFNFPLNLAVHKIAPALATGNTIILKPPHQAPSASLLLGELALEAGITPGSFNVLPAMPSEADCLVTDDRIKMLSFTGSAKVGWEMKNRAGKKKICLELGGNAAAIVCSDANLDFAIPRLANGAFSYSGQVCISVQRIYVQEEIYHNFVERFGNFVKSSIKYGDPNNPETIVGPMIDNNVIKRTQKWLEEAIGNGAKFVTGGNTTQNILEPTVLTNVNHQSPVYCEEVFAPVVIIEKFKTFSEALELVNNSNYGLQAGVFTRDIKNSFEAYNKLEVGGVIINDYPTFRIDNMPYGGIKDSGFGREGITYTMEEMTELKIMVLNFNSL